MTRTTEQKNRIRIRTADVMKKLAETNQCPVCNRKAALSVKFDRSGPVEVCRWKDCNYKRRIGEII